MNIKLNTNDHTTGSRLLKMMGLLIVSIGFYFSAGAQTFDWAIHAGDSSGNGSVIRTAVALDAAGNVYVTGDFEGTTDFDPGSGQAYLSPLGDYAVFLAKYDASGKYLWAKEILGSGKGALRNYAYDVAVDEKGGVYVTGNFYGTAYFNTKSGVDSLSAGNAPYTEIFVAKYDDKGNQVWTKQTHSSGNSRIAQGEGVAVDGVGNVCITGIYEGLIDFDLDGQGQGLLSSGSNFSGNQSNIFIAKYDPNGTYIWAKGVGGVGHGEGFDIAVDTRGNKNDVYVTGYFADTLDFDPGAGIANLTGGTTTAQTGFLAKYDSNGRYIWANAIAGTKNNKKARIQSKALAIDTSGNVYISGFFADTVDFDPGPNAVTLTGLGLIDMFLAKYDAGGNYLWAGRMGNVGSITQAAGIALDKKVGNVYLTGSFMGRVDFDPGPDTAILTPSGTLDVFLAKYDACGHYLWAGNMKGNAAGVVGSAYGIAINTGANVYLTGNFSGPTDFDFWSNSTMLTPTGSGDAYLSKVHFNDTVLPPTYLTVSTCVDSYTFYGTVYTESGTYKQVIPGIIHCDSTIILTLNLDSINKPYITTNGFILGVSSTYAAYQWIKNNVPIPGATNRNYTVTENGDYKVAVTSDAGCTDTSDVYKVTNYTGINDLTNLAKQISVYPNPTSDNIYVQSPVPVNIILTDITGRTIQSIKDAHNISVKDLEAGLYLLQIKDKAGLSISTVKVVKK